MGADDARRVTIATPDGTFVAIEHGAPDAPLVLCVHGFPDHPRTFDGIAGALTAAGYRCVAPWLRGYAPSTLAGPFDIGQIAADIVAMKRALSPNRPAVLIGHDWGAIASYFAVGTEPAEFSHAVTLAVPHPLGWARNTRLHPAQLRLSWYIAFFQLGAVADYAVKRDKFALIDRLWRDWSPGYTPSIDYMRDLKRCLSTSMPAPLGYYRAMFAPRLGASAARKAALERTRRILVPTLYLHGANDGCMLPQTGDGQERYFARGFESHTLPDVGHVLQLEAPDRVATLITNFLAATPT